MRHSLAFRQLQAAVLAIVLCDALASHLSAGVALVMLGELVLIGSVTALRPVPEALVEQ